MARGGSKLSKWRRRLKWARRVAVLISLAGAAQKYLRPAPSGGATSAQRDPVRLDTGPRPAARPLLDDREPADDPTPAWVDAADGDPPDGYRVKVKTKSGIYHVEGGFAYERTKPDRWYRSPADAEADGFRPSKA